MPSTTATRDRLLAEGMRLFGEQGYTATSVAQIESAAGLSPGSGSLYKHFRSKEELLTAGLDRLLGGRHPLLAEMQEPAAVDIQERLAEVARAALRRLDDDRDLNRLLFRGLESFPELLRRFGDDEIARIHRSATSMLVDLTGNDDVDVDWAAISVVLQGATAHYWLLRDVFGRHPTGVDEERFVQAVTALTAALIGTAQADEPS